MQAGDPVSKTTPDIIEAGTFFVSVPGRYHRLLNEPGLQAHISHYVDFGIIYEQKNIGK